MKIIDFQTICNSVDCDKVVGSGPRNCRLTLRAADLLSTREHVFLKESTTRFISTIFAYQFRKKKKMKTAHVTLANRNSMRYYISYFYYTLHHFHQSQKINVLLSIHWSRG